MESIYNKAIPLQADIAILVFANNACTDNPAKKLPEFQKWQIDNHLLPIEFVEEPKADILCSE